MKFLLVFINTIVASKFVTKPIQSQGGTATNALVITITSNYADNCKMQVLQLSIQVE